MISNIALINKSKVAKKAQKIITGNKYCNM